MYTHVFKISDKYIANEDLCSLCTIPLWCVWMARFGWFGQNSRKIYSKWRFMQSMYHTIMVYLNSKIFFSFFFFLMGNTDKLYWILEASNTSCRRAWSRKLGLSSTQIEKSLMPSAYLANRWAGLLPCLFTWETSTLRNSLKADRVLETMAATDEGGGVISFRALTNNKESPSRMKSCMCKSLTNWMPTSNALA